MSSAVDCVRFFFFKQKTAYEMRISDWSSDVCSSDLALLHDLRRLAHFFNANHEAIITVAIRADGDFKVHAIIDIVWLRPAKVPGNAGAADHWTGKAPFDRVFLADHRDIHEIGRAHV